MAAPSLRSGTVPGRGFLKLPVLLALLTAGSAHAAVEGYHYTREVVVTEAGWVRVPLDLAAIQHLAPGGADLHVLSPSGGEAPLRIETTAARTERRPAKSSTVERGGSTESGWTLLLDLGANTIPHERLFLQTVRPSIAPPDQIESSPDGAHWQPLTPGGPFRAEGENWISISYPVTSDRWLRLHWPREAGAPKIEAAEVESVTGPTLAIATRNADCDPGPPGAIFCTLPLPAAGQVVRRLTVELQEKGSVGYRLDAPREGGWRSVVEGVWQPSQPAGGRARHVLNGGAEALDGDLLRLELYSAPGTAPRLLSYGFELTVQTVLFDAEEAGRYTLAYGGPPRRMDTAPAPPAGEEASWLEAGAEAEHPLPPLPAPATAPSVRLESGRLKAAWRVTATAARPGSLVRLELPESVYAAARADLGNLRLVTGDRQIPFYRWSPAAPALALWEGSVRPTGDVRARESTLEVRLARSGLPLTELDAMAPAQPLHRGVMLSYLEPAAHLARRAGEPKAAPSPTLRAIWDCMPQAPIPCRLRMPLPGRAPSVLSLRFHDGDNPPLPDLDTAVWRRRDLLLFVWPQAVPKGTSVRLVAGADSLKVPSYDLQALGDTLINRPWQPAEITSGGDAPAGGPPWWGRWLRPLMLGLAAIWLILLLRRILMES